MTEPQVRGTDTDEGLRLRDAVAEILGEPDHAHCRTTEAGSINEANCIVEGLFHRGFHPTDSDAAIEVEAARDEGRREAVEHIERVIREEQSMASDDTESDQFEQGAMAAYSHVLGSLPVVAGLNASESGQPPDGTR